ncbi:MAG: sigma-E processing peptidase SpoIIGA [Emergencia sp.]
MTIYSEYFFLENFIAGMVFAYTSKLITGGRPGGRRLVLSGILAGLYAFIIFVPVPPAAAVLTVVAFCLVQGWLMSAGMSGCAGTADDERTARKKGRHGGVQSNRKPEPHAQTAPDRRTIRRVESRTGAKKAKRMVGCGFIYFLVTVFYGGVTNAILRLGSFRGLAGAVITGSGAMYMPALTYTGLMAAATAAAMVIVIAIRLVKAKRIDRETRVKAAVSFDGVSWVLDGMIDTGNSLKEPVTGRPVALVSGETLKKMTDRLEHKETRYVLVPYVSVGERGTLQGYRADSMSVSGTVIVRPVIAASRQSLGDIQILLPGELMERGIYGNS